MQTALISHCEQHGNRMAVLDAPPGMTPQQIKEWRSDDAMYDSAYAALYYPWIKVENPIGVNGDAEVFVPPSGHIAGVWARTDETRGVWKAPANDTIRGVLDIERGHHPERAGPAQPDRHQLHPAVRHPRHPHLGRPHAVLGHRLALHQRPPAVQHDRGDDPRGHPVRGLRAERHEAVGGRQAHAQRASCAGCGRPARCSAPPPTRRSTSSATPRPTRRSRSTRASSSSRSASRRSSPPSSSSSVSASRSRPRPDRGASHRSRTRRRNNRCPTT